MSSKIIKPESIQKRSGTFDFKSFVNDKTYNSLSSREDSEIEKLKDNLEKLRSDNDGMMKLIQGSNFGQTDKIRSTNSKEESKKHMNVNDISRDSGLRLSYQKLTNQFDSHRSLRIKQKGQGFQNQKYKSRHISTPTRRDYLKDMKDQIQEEISPTNQPGAQMNINLSSQYSQKSPITDVKGLRINMIKPHDRRNSDIEGTDSSCQNPTMLIYISDILIYVYKASDKDAWFEYEDPNGQLMYSNKSYCKFMNTMDSCTAYMILDEAEFLADHLEYILERDKPSDLYFKSQIFLTGLNIVIIIIQATVFGLIQAFKDAFMNSGLALAQGPSETMNLLSPKQKMTYFNPVLYFSEILSMLTLIYGIYCINSHNLKKHNLFQILLVISLILDTALSAFCLIQSTVVASRLALFIYEYYVVSNLLKPILKIKTALAGKDSQKEDISFQPLLEEDEEQFNKTDKLIFTQVIQSQLNCEENVRDQKLSQSMIV